MFGSSCPIFGKANCGLGVGFAASGNGLLKPGNAAGSLRRDFLILGNDFPNLGNGFAVFVNQ